MISWIFLILSAVLFSSSFLCNKLFGKMRGSSLQTSIEYTFFGAIIACISMFIIGKGHLEFTWFSVLMAVIYSANNFALTYFGIKAFKYANLSVYSMFMMLGSIVIPSAVGIAFYDEVFTYIKALCFVIIFIALFLSTSKGKSDKRAIIYYVLVFVGNGMAGVISKVHQSFDALKVDTQSFLFTAGAIRLIVSAAILIFFYFIKKKAKPSARAGAMALGGGLLNAVGNYFNLYALIDIPVTVHSVMTTGMVLIGSAVIGLFLKEKISGKAAISLALALVAVVLSVL